MQNTYAGNTISLLAVAVLLDNWLTMDKMKLQPFLDKMKIIFKEPCKKWDMDRYHYVIKIGDEVFNYYGSAKEYEDEQYKIDMDNHFVWWKLFKWKPVRKISLPTDDDIKTSALYALINDYYTYEDYSMEDFIDAFGYKAKEWIRIYKELEINHFRMNNVFTTDELRLLQELYQDC